MRLYRLLIVAGLLLTLWRPASAQTFGLKSVVVNRNVPTQSFVVRTNSKLPAPSTIAERHRWQIAVTRPAGTTVYENASPAATTPIRDIRVAANGGSITITFDVPGFTFAGVTNMVVVFDGPTELLTASYKAPDAPGALGKAKGKEDADVYLAGGLVAAQQSSPIVMIDTKLKLGWPYGRDFHWAGVNASFAINPEPKPPADSNDVNPDAISIFYQMDWARALPVNPVFYGIQLVATPFGGELSSDPVSGNLMGGGQINFYSQPFFGRLVVDPFVGAQIGVNKRKPDTLFEQPVDLTNYDDIRRVTYGLDMALYNFGKEVTADNLYRFVATFSWKGWGLGTDEPFVESQSKTDEAGKRKRIKVLELKGGTRNYVEASVAYNVTDHFGVAITAKRGSQPPLFQHLDAQVALNLTFKAKLRQDLKAGTRGKG